MDQHEDIRNRFLKPFVDETIIALDTMADLTGCVELTLNDGSDVFDLNNFAVCIVTKTSGAIEGNIILSHKLDTALAIGNKVRGKMLGITDEDKELNDELRECLAEFANTAIGLAIRHLNDINKTITFSPPMYMSHPQDCNYLLDEADDIVTTPIAIKDVGTFQFSYIVQKQER